MREDFLTTEEAVSLLRSAGMRISRQTLRDGIRQGVFPFGDCVRTGRSQVFYIYRSKLCAWINERTGAE